MSGINGDKSRFHRERKQKIARRKRNRELLKSLAAQADGPSICFEAKGGVRMTTPVLASPLSEPIRSPLKKKRVLLVDTSPTKRDLRAEIMRKLGMEVDCAAVISEAS